MKTRLFSLSGLGAIAIAAVLFPTTASAQTGGGIKFGVNLANVRGFNDSTTSSSQRTGIVVGGFMTFGVSPLVSFQPELLFSMQGSKLHFSGSGVESNSTRKLDYVQLPLLARFGNKGSDHASLYAIAGPTLGVLVRATDNGTNVKSSLKRTDVGVVVGAGVTLTRLMFEARYTYDLVDFNKVADPSGSHKNRVVSFLVGVVF